ncbi:Nn.00g113180.m01.CDS01 [Neocucurbitaria sp. VM-36]
MPALSIRGDDPSRKDDKGPTIVSMSVVFTTIAFVTTCLRLWVRKGRRALGLDDYTITAAMCLTIVEAGLTIQAVTHGKGKRGIYLSRSDREYINMYSWYAQHVLFAAMALVKISVCLLVMRIKNSKAMKWLTGVVIAVLCTSALECSIVLLAQCRPISAHWRPTPGACWPAEVRIYSIYVQAGFSIATDLICSLLPIVIMWNIQLPFRKKMSIWALMAIGLVCTACSAVRAKSLNAKAQDLAYEYGIVAIWAITELCLGIVATNAALSRSIYYCLFKSSEISTQHSSQRPTYAYSGRSRDGYAQHPDFPPRSDLSETSKIERRELSTARSEDSDIPLKPVSGIEKTAKIEMHVQ